MKCWWNSSAFKNNTPELPGITRLYVRLKAEFTLRRVRKRSIKRDIKHLWNRKQLLTICSRGHLKWNVLSLMHSDHEIIKQISFWLCVLYVLVWINFLYHVKVTVLFFLYVFWMKMKNNQQSGVICFKPCSIWCNQIRKLQSYEFGKSPNTHYKFWSIVHIYTAIPKDFSTSYTFTHFIYEL